MKLPWVNWHTNTANQIVVFSFISVETFSPEGYVLPYLKRNLLFVIHTFCQFLCSLYSPVWSPSCLGIQHCSMSFPYWSWRGEHNPPPLFLQSLGCQSWNNHHVFSVSLNVTLPDRVWVVYILNIIVIYTKLVKCVLYLMYKCASLYVRVQWPHSLCSQHATTYIRYHLLFNHDPLCFFISRLFIFRIWRFRLAIKVWCLTFLCSGVLYFLSATSNTVLYRVSNAGPLTMWYIVIEWNSVGG